MAGAHLGRIRLELNAGSLANQQPNHSGQGGVTGWTSVTTAKYAVAFVSNPTRSGQTLAGTYAGNAIRVTASALSTAMVTSPTFAVNAGVWVGVTFSFAIGDIDSRARVSAILQFLDSSGTVIKIGPLYTAAPDPASDNPWTMSQGGMTGASLQQQAPANTANARLLFGATTTDGSWPASRIIYLAKIMAVIGATQGSIANVAYSDTTTWQNISGQLTSLQVNRGGEVQGVLDELDAGTITAVLRDAQLDPTRNALIRPGRGIRVTSCGMLANPATGTWIPIFTGKIVTADVKYADRTNPAAKPTVTITASDAVVDLRRIAAPYNYSGTYAAKARALLASYSGQWAADAGSASTVAVTSDADASLWDQLILARNTFPAAKLYVRNDGILNAITAAAPTSWYCRFTDQTPLVLTNLVDRGSCEVGALPAALGSAVTTTAPNTTTPLAGARSGRISASAAGVPSVLFVSDTYGGGTTSISAATPGSYISARVLVRAVQACYVNLSVSIGGGGQTTSVQLAAGASAVISLADQYIDPSTYSTGPAVQMRISVTSAAGTGNVAAGSWVDFDQVCLIQTVSPLDGIAVPYVDGATAGGSWAGTAYASPGTAPVAVTDTPYLDIDVNFGSRALVNQLMINCHNSGEVDGEKAYGPYTNAASIASWGLLDSEVDAVDPTPSVVAAGYLQKYANPVIFPTTISVNATDSYQGVEHMLELYAPVRVQYAAAGLIGTFYVVGIEHEVTAARWVVTYRLRPIDQSAAVSVTNPAAGANTGPSDVQPVEQGPISSWFLTNNQSIPTGTGWTTLVLDTKLVDQGGLAYDQTNARWTIPRTGRYLVIATARLLSTASSTRRNIQIVVNGNTLRGVAGAAGSAGYPSVDVEVVLFLQAGDVVAVQVAQDTGAAVNAQGSSTGRFTAADITWLGT